MKVSEVKKILKARILVGEEHEDTEVLSAFGSDLMSDVMAFVNESVLLLTGLINPQVIRTAEMMDIKAIVFVRGKHIDDEILNLAKEKNIIVISTKYTMYISSGLLYEAGLSGNGVRGQNE
jgi:predicted transcriptional regulator